MAKRYDNLLIPYTWYNDFVSVLGKDEPDEELAKGRIWYLFLSDRAGEQVMSGDPAIDYTVQALLNQLKRMRPDNEERDKVIAELRSEGKSSREIGALLGISDGAVRKTAGWSKFDKIL